MDFCNASFLYTTLQLLSTYKVLLQGGRSSSSLSSSSPLDNSFVHFLYLTTLLYSFSSPFHATSQNAQSLASYYFVLIMAAVAVPRLLVNGNRTGGAAAAEVHIGDSPSCNRPLCTASRLGCEERKRESQRVKSSNSKESTGT